MNYRNCLILLLASLIFTGCGEKKKTYPIDGFAVAGQITYEKRTPTVFAGQVIKVGETAVVPCAYVEVIDTSDDDRVITYGTTNDDGVFNIGLPEELQNSPLAVRVFTISGLDKFPLEVLNQPTGDVSSSRVPYTFQAEPFIGPKNDMNIHISKDVGAAAGAFNIYSQILRGFKFVVEEGMESQDFPSLKVNWEPGNDGVGCTCFFNQFLFQATINLRADEDDDSVILHEFGHYLQEVFSNASSPGGLHIISCTQNDDPQLTYSEGWATGFSCMVRKSEYYIDTATEVGSFYVPHEDPCHIGQGSTSETVVAAMFLDLYDGISNGMPSNDSDTLSIPFKDIWFAFKNVRSGSGIVVFDYFDSITDLNIISKVSWELNFSQLGLDEAAMFLARP